MNAYDLRTFLNLLEEKGQDLKNLPILFIEDRSNVRFGVQADKNDINFIENIRRFNEESDTTWLQTQFDNAILIGPIIEIE